MSKDSIWITGAEGRLGSALVQLLKKDVKNKVVGTDRDVDVTDMEAVDHAANVYHPNIVINCASISDAECCEKDMVEAFRVNALGARNLASATRRLNAKLIQLSTDDVFDGKASGRMTEFDIPDPQTVYGKSKLAGENYVRELNPRHLIIRSSWVYGAADGETAQDYFAYVVEQGKNQRSFEAPFDRISTPTSAGELARFICSLLDKTEYGIYHASCEGVCSRYEFARTILALMGYDPALVKGTFSSHNGRQISTLLENLMMKMTEIHTMPQWMDDLKAYVEEYKSRKAEQEE